LGIRERREREKNERRQSILRAALELFMEEGYHNTTVDRIAERAEVGRATLYLHFKTKDEIFVRSIIELTDYFGYLLQDIYNRREDIKDTLFKEVWRSLEESYNKDPVAFNAILYFYQGEMQRKLPKKLRFLIDRSGSQNFNLLSKIIEYGISQGSFIDCNPKTLAEVIWASFLGIMHIEDSKNISARKTHRKITIDLAFEVLTKGVQKSSKESQAG